MIEILLGIAVIILLALILGELGRMNQRLAMIQEHQLKALTKRVDQLAKERGGNDNPKT